MWSVLRSTYSEKTEIGCRKWKERWYEKSISVSFYFSGYGGIVAFVLYPMVKLITQSFYKVNPMNEANSPVYRTWKIIQRCFRQRHSKKHW